MLPLFVYPEQSQMFLTRFGDRTCESESAFGEACTMRVRLFGQPTRLLNYGYLLICQQINGNLNQANVMVASVNNLPKNLTFTI